MKTPTLIGAIIFMISLMIAIIAILRLDFIIQLLEERTVDEKQYFEFFFLWISGVIGGLGLGYGNRESSYGYSEGSTPTIIGGLGLGGVIVISVLMLISGTPVPGIGVTFIAAILAILGLYMVAVSTQESY
ncbi:MAG: hypothetical protein JSV04_00475 [Candidatus Heimdallarchaeota archaeon]|nr:MAG: hypothetical protein JSV04_00475 [Candidatus Heimdallarchaeota archaeon]